MSEAPRYPYHEIEQEPGEGAMKFRWRVIRAAREFAKTHELVGADGTKIINPGYEIELTEGEVEAHGGKEAGRRNAALARQREMGHDRKDYARRITDNFTKPWIGGSRLSAKSLEEKAENLAAVDRALAEAHAGDRPAA